MISIFKYLNAKCDIFNSIKYIITKNKLFFYKYFKLKIKTNNLLSLNKLRLIINLLLFFIHTFV